MNQLYKIIEPVRKKEDKNIHRFIWCLSIFGILTFGWAAKKINGY